MPDTPHDPLPAMRAELDQAVMAAPEVARVAHGFFDAFTEEGFSSRQALYLVAVQLLQKPGEPPESEARLHRTQLRPGTMSPRDRQISEILTPEGLRKLDAIQDDLEHRMLFGEPDSAREQEENQCPGSS